MKYITSILFFLMMAAVSISQNTAEKEIIFSYAPAGLVNKVRVKVEVPVTENFSTGSFLSFHYLFFKGPELEPFARLYLSDVYPEGFYMQAKISAGFFLSEMDFVHVESDSTELKIKRSCAFPGYGAGLALGYQYINRKGRYIDLFGGFKIMPYKGPEFITEQGIVYRTDYDFNWYLLGPGSRINCHFGVGYSF